MTGQLAVRIVDGHVVREPGVGPVAMVWLPLHGQVSAASAARTSGAPRMAPKPLTELFDRESRWVLRAEEAFKAMHQAKGTASLADALDAVFRGAYEATPLEDES